MKRFFCLMFALIFFPIVSIADLPDISSLSFDELVQLRKMIDLAMWNSEEWEEVTVPSGTYKIGDDIPAGHWSIRVSGHNLVLCYYCEQVDEVGDPVCFGSKYVSKSISSEDFKGFNEYDHIVDFDMKDGWFFYVDGPVIFTPYAGKPLGFKTKEP